MINKLLLLISVSLINLVTSAPSDDEVTKLDGYLDFSNLFKMYSGYLELQA